MINILDSAVPGDIIEYVDNDEIIVIVVILSVVIAFCILGIIRIINKKNKSKWFIFF